MKWTIDPDSPPPTGLCECVAVIFVFPLFLDMAMYANEFDTKEKQKLTEIKNYLHHTPFSVTLIYFLLK